MGHKCFSLSFFSTSNFGLLRLSQQGSNCVLGSLAEVMASVFFSFYEIGKEEELVFTNSLSKCMQNGLRIKWGYRIGLALERISLV